MSSEGTVGFCYTHDKPCSVEESVARREQRGTRHNTDQLPV